MVERTGETRTVIEPKEGDDPLPHRMPDSLQLQVETIAACNARCVFCTYPNMERKRGRMGMDVYRKVLDDARYFPKVSEISLQGLGEPLMDVNILDRVRLAREAFPATPISLYTNASLLTPQKADQLEEAGLTLLVVSLTGLNREQRKAAMGLDDFDGVVTALDWILAKKPRPLNVFVKLVQSRDLIDWGDPEAFVERWQGNAFITYEGNWAGQLYKFRGAPLVKACGRALGQVMVLWDGRVAICCFDGEGQEIYGDVKTTPLVDIWNSPRAQEVRALHLTERRAKIPICAGCTGI